MKKAAPLLASEMLTNAILAHIPSCRSPGKELERYRVYAQNRLFVSNADLPQKLKDMMTKTIGTTDSQGEAAADTMPAPATAPIAVKKEEDSTAGRKRLRRK